MKKSGMFLAACMSGLLAASLLTACGGSASSSKETTKAGSVAETSAAEESSSGSQTASDGKSYKIGVLQLVQHPALDKSNEGFADALKDSGLAYTIDSQNASGEQSNCQTIADKFVNDGDDLIYAIATPAAQAVSAATTEIPIVICAVTDPAGSGLVESNDKPGTNVTGASDLTPVAEQINLIGKLLPDAKKVGVLYCTAESNSEIQAKMAHDACDKAGLTWKDYTVSSSNEIQSVVESMIGNVDVIYAPTDNTIASGFAIVAQTANDNGIPTICGEEGMVSEGGLATYGIDYYKLGYLAGQQAVEILKDGKNPAEMPIVYEQESECTLSVNDETAKTLGIDTSVLSAK